MSTGERVWINGKTVPAAEAAVSVFDRSFLYGDGLFEAIRWSNGKPFRWQPHVGRLEAGARFLGIRLLSSSDELLSAAENLARENGMREGIVRIQVTRGIGRRGYSPQGAETPAIIITTHDAPAISSPPLRWSLKTSSFQLLAGDPLAGFKTANKLLQIVARTEAEAAGFNEALLLNSLGNIAESTTGNVFWIENGVPHTPPLVSGILPGITRAVMVEIADDLGLGVAETETGVERLKRADGVFLTMTGAGVVEVTRLDQTELSRSPKTAALSAAYRALLARETS